MRGFRYCKIGGEAACRRFRKTVEGQGQEGPPQTAEAIMHQEAVNNDLVPILETKYMCPTCPLRGLVQNPNA